MKSAVGKSSCTVLIARTGIEMAEAHRDNLMHLRFVLKFHADRTTFRCAWLSNFSDLPLPSGRHVCSIQRMTTHNPCVHLDGHDRTGQNPGDKHSATR
jgi:hypothetical protein